MLIEICIIGVFCVHKPGFLMPGHIRTYIHLYDILAIRAVELMLI